MTAAIHIERNMRLDWSGIEVISVTRPDSIINQVSTDGNFEAEVVLGLRNIKPEDIGVEILVASVNEKGQYHIEEKCELAVVSSEADKTVYRANLVPAMAGFYQMAVRMYAKNDLLPHRQDFELVKWL